MTEQTEQSRSVVSAEVDPQTHTFVPTGILGAETSGSSMVERKVQWILRSTTGQARFIEERPKTLTEQFNEAYDEDARREDEEFVRTTKAYYRRRFNAND